MIALLYVYIVYKSFETFQIEEKILHVKKNFTLAICNFRAKLISFEKFSKNCPYKILNHKSFNNFKIDYRVLEIKESPY